MTGARYAILVASSRFPKAQEKLAPLVGPENDVEQLKEILSSHDHGNFGKIAVLKNKPSHTILQKINETLNSAAKNDLILIYYSGHGKLDVGGQLHLATVNTSMATLETTSIPLERIRTLFANSPSAKTVLILDCCYSGAVGKAFRGEVDEQLNLASGGTGTFIMTASTGLQMAQEKEEDKLGIFTRHLVEGVRTGDADRDGDGLITMNEIYNYVHDRVLQESPQKPMKWDLSVSGEMIFAKSGKSSAVERSQQIRERLFELVQSGVLPDSIFRAAFDVISKGPQERVGILRQYDDLLDEVLQDDFRQGPFIDKWLAIDLAKREEKHKTTPITAVAPPPEPVPEPAPPTANKPLPPEPAISAPSGPAMPGFVSRILGSNPGSKSSADDRKKEVRISMFWLIGVIITNMFIKTVFFS